MLPGITPIEPWIGHKNHEKHFGEGEEEQLHYSLEKTISALTGVEETAIFPDLVGNGLAKPWLPT